MRSLVRIKRLSIQSSGRQELVRKKLYHACREPRTEDGHREEIELSGFAGGSLLAVFWLKFKKEDSGT
jgi:hypothetical protein